MSYTVVSTAAGTAYAVAEVPQPQVCRILDSPADLLWQNIARPVKISHDSLIVEAELGPPGRALRAAYKQYRPRNWWKAFLGLFRGGRAMRCWRHGRALLAHRIAVARPLVACRPKGWRQRATSYLATEWIEGAENLHLFGWRLAAEPLPRRLRRAARCAESLGRLIGRMHAAAVAHRDLKAANLLVVESADGVETYLVDLDGVRICRSLSPARRAADLARLAVALEAHPWVARTVCRRFLRAYAAEFPPAAVAWKPLWRSVAARSRRMVRGKRRRRQQVL